jgi:hypothetical protein
MDPDFSSSSSALNESGITVPSDSETYSASPADSSFTPLILYSPPTIWGLLRGAAINVLLPFVNGLMLGFGELVANEAAFRLGWGGTKVRRKSRSYVWKEDAGIQHTVEATDTGQWMIGGLTMRYRYFRAAAVTHDELGQVWRCARILWSGGGGMGRSWICILRWSRETGRQDGENGVAEGSCMKCGV